MDDIEKLKAENSDLRTNVDELTSNKYCLEGELRKSHRNQRKTFAYSRKFVKWICEKGGLMMHYIKAKFPNSTRSYVYRTEDSVKAGDMVVNDKGAKLTVTDETVDMKWVETYGADKMAVVKKYEESEE